MSFQDYKPLIFNNKISNPESFKLEKVSLSKNIQNARLHSAHTERPLVRV